MGDTRNLRHAAGVAVVGALLIGTLVACDTSASCIQAPSKSPRRAVAEAAMLAAAAEGHGSGGTAGHGTGEDGSTGSAPREGTGYVPIFGGTSTQSQPRPAGTPKQ